MKNKDEKMLLLYLFKEPNLKEIDIYKLSKNMLKLRGAIRYVDHRWTKRK